MQPKNNVKNTFKQYTQNSLKALNENKFDEAITWANKAILADKLDTLGYQLLALAHDKNGNKKLAYEAITQHLTHTQNINFKIYKAELAANNTLYQEAIAIFVAVLEEAQNNIQALTGLFFCYKRINDYTGMYVSLRKIKFVRPLNTDEANHYLIAFQKIKITNGFEDALAEVIEILDIASIDTRLAAYAIGELTINYLPELTQAPDPTTDQRILGKLLFWKTLSKVCIHNLHIDQFATHARKKILLDAMETGEISDDALFPCLCIAEQNQLNEYIHFASDHETEIVMGLVRLIELNAQQPEWEPKDSEAIFLLLLMYMPLNALSYKDTLAQHPLTMWPTSISPIVKKTLFEPLLEIEIGSNLPQLSQISSETPAKVIAQYEENPYPRWEKAAVFPAGSIGKYIQYLHPKIILNNAAYDEDFNILIAGCGTGKQAIQCELLFPKAHITAFDISFRSLGYAKRKHEDYALKNVKFLYGDILALDESLGKFNYIECCGVLHHLQDPKAGWKKLVDHLADEGLMRIDLYSKIARQAVIEQRQYIATLNIGTSAQDLRRFRQAIIHNNPNNSLFKFRDFYNTSEFRDLLFHPQETQYTLLDIDVLLSELGLKIVAMHVEAEKQNLFRKEFPLGDMQNLIQWHEVELKNQVMFSDMYAFWCMKI
jgi:SAM-dependent methyltransferase